MAHVVRERLSQFLLISTNTSVIRGLARQHKLLRPIHRSFLVSASSHYHQQSFTPDSYHHRQRFISTPCTSVYSLKPLSIPEGCCSALHFSTRPNRQEQNPRDNPKEDFLQKPSEESVVQKPEPSLSDNADLSSTQKEVQSVDEIKEPEVENPTLLQRFRATYRQYGKILIVVHSVTATVWFSSFYYLAASGLDVVALLKWMGASDLVIKPFTLPGVGNLAVMYLLYKLATPIRYPVTIIGTQLTARVLRHYGYLPPIPEQNRLRSLVRDGQAHMKDKVQQRRERSADARANRNKETK